MKVSNENYHSPEANREYRSFSQIKTAMDCQARWLAEIEGRFVREESPALVHGSYVDLTLTEPEKLDEFLSDEDNRAHLFTKKGDDNAAKKVLDAGIARARRDPLFMAYLTGEYQIIITCEIGGHPFKCKLDVLDCDEKREVDLKTTADMNRKEWFKAPDGTFHKMHWIYAYRYHMQRALYREAVYQKYWFRPTPHIAAISKEKVPDIKIFSFAHWRPVEWSAILSDAIGTMDIMAEILAGDREPESCGECDYCKKTKVLSEPEIVEFDTRVVAF